MTETTFAKAWPVGTHAGSETATDILSTAAGKAWRTLLTWQRRASERTHLAELDDRAYKDMGITRADAWRETQKPFWSA
jgi:uncharacterized protein YjiS (DUF1127 family)